MYIGLNRPMSQMHYEIIPMQIMLMTGNVVLISKNI